MLYQFDKPNETPFMDFAPGQDTPYKHGGSTDNMMQMQVKKQLKRMEPVTKLKLLPVHVVQPEG